jgi:hypothetical protein
MSRDPYQCACGRVDGHGEPFCQAQYATLQAENAALRERAERAELTMVSERDFAITRASELHERLATAERERDEARRIATSALNIAHDRTTVLGSGEYGAITRLREELALLARRPIGG